MSFFRKSKKKGKKASEADGFDPPDAGNATYDEVGGAAAAGGESRRRGNFMEQPADGWKHDNRGMAAGMGVYFTFAVKYVGAMTMPKSVSTVAHEAQTDITREAIALVCDASIPSRVQVRRELSREAAEYPYGDIMTWRKNVRLSISATGIVLAPVSRDDAIIAFYPMKNISLATGGEDLDYDFISFTARNEETKARESHVFDCDTDSDAVMEALGQAFSLARELQGKAGQVQSGLTAGYLDVVPDGARAAMAPPPGAEALYADLDSVMQGGLDNPTYGMHDAGGAPAAGATYMDVKPVPIGGGAATYMDVKPNAPAAGGDGAYMDVKPDPIGFALASHLAQGEALYDSAGSGLPIGAKVAEVLNQHDTYMDLAPNPVAAAADDTYLEMPAWKAYDDTALANRISVEELDDAYGV